jgi:(1->4)-alpha-D-glucan 1-alpha-D-glucosylmutase
MTKALHEAKINLSWINTNQEYVDAIAGFIRRILTPDSSNTFLPLVEEFLPKIQYFGCINSVAQALLKLTAPGLPDIYQGNELFDFSLVDPDNRRPVDYRSRRALLEKMQQVRSDEMRGLCQEMLRTWDDGRMKLWTTARTLQFRRTNPALFRSGKYLPLHGNGTAAKHICAFARQSQSESALAIASRFSHSLMRGEALPPLGDVWGDAEIALPRNSAQYFENVLTGEVVKKSGRDTLLCREVLATFPAALLSGK